MEHIPLPDQRKKWMTARSRLQRSDLDYATREDRLRGRQGREAARRRPPDLAGDAYTLADINFYAHCGM